MTFLQCLYQHYTTVRVLLCAHDSAVSVLYIHAPARRRGQSLSSSAPSLGQVVVLDAVDCLASFYEMEFINSDDKMEPTDLVWILASVLCLWKIGSGI